MIVHTGHINYVLNIYQPLLYWYNILIQYTSYVIWLLAPSGSRLATWLVYKQFELGIYIFNTRGNQQLVDSEFYVYMLNTGIYIPCIILFLKRGFKVLYKGQMYSTLPVQQKMAPLEWRHCPILAPIGARQFIFSGEKRYLNGAFRHLCFHCRLRYWRHGYWRWRHHRYLVICTIADPQLRSYLGTMGDYLLPLYGLYMATIRQFI